MLATPRLAIHTAPAHDYAGTDDMHISLVHLLQAATRLTSNPCGVAKDVPCCPRPSSVTPNPQKPRTVIPLGEQCDDRGRRT